MKRLEHGNDEDSFLFGAALSLTELRHSLGDYPKKKLLNDVLWLMDEYSTPSVRNVAVRIFRFTSKFYRLIYEFQTWAGSLLSAHGDFPCLALSLNIKIYLYNFDKDESSIIRVDENFFTSGRSVITGNTIITHCVMDFKEVCLPPPPHPGPLTINQKPIMGMFGSKFISSGIRTRKNLSIFR